MTLRRDHVGGAALIALSVAVYLIGLDLPFGTAASPGPGMLPDIAAAIMAGLGLVIVAGARASSALATVSFDDVPHALRVMAAAALAASLYTTLGFPLTIGALLLGLMWGVERNPLLPSVLFAACMTGGTYLLLATLLKTPLPRGVLGL